MGVGQVSNVSFLDGDGGGGIDGDSYVLNLGVVPAQQIKQRKAREPSVEEH